MRGILLRSFRLCTRHLKSKPLIPSNYQHPNRVSGNVQSYTRFPSTIRFFSSEDGKSDPQSSSSAVAEKEVAEVAVADVEDVSNKELKSQIEEYFKDGNEEVLPGIFESILKRRLSEKHEDTDEELMDELQMKPLDDVKDDEFESDFEEAHDTDSDIENLYSTREIVEEKMTAGPYYEKEAGDPYFNMTDTKWDEMIKEAIEHGHLQDTKECEEILEDMLHHESLLPDDVKRRIEEKFNEIGDRVENGELEVEEGYALFKEFEDKIVEECAELDAEPPQFDEEDAADSKRDLDDPPGEGPILRWETRVVFAPGGEAWHPKNRKVKLSVTVKELGLSKPQFVRLRELVGKRYNPGKDELTVTSERFEHREENRKDCLRTLFALIEEAGKARTLLEEARTSEIKDRLKANPKFMQILAKKKGLQIAS